MMMMQTLIKAALFTAVAAAADILPRSADGTTGFRLWANNLYPDSPGDGPDIQGQELGYISTNACKADVIFVPAGQGVVFNTNNDTIGVTHLDDDDTSPFAGMVIPWRGPAMVPSRRPVELQCGNSTEGVFLAEDGVRYPEEMGPDHNGAFMACERGDDVILSFFGWGQRPIWGCTVLQLLPIY